MVLQQQPDEDIGAGRRERRRDCVLSYWELFRIGPGGLIQLEFTETVARHLWTYFCKIKYLIFQR